MKKSRRHALEDLGVVTAARGDIRVEVLNDRLKPKVPFPHRHDFFHLHFVEKGKGTHRIDFKTYSLDKNQVYVMKPGQVHAWDISPGVKGIVLEFTSESLPPDLRKSLDLVAGLNSVPDMLSLKNPQDIKRIQFVFESMLEEFQKQKSAYQVVLQHQLSELLILLLRTSGVEWSVQKPLESLMDQFQSLLDESYSQEHSVEFYAKKLGMTPKALTMRASRAFGKSAREMIQERVLVEAKRLLVYSKLSISEVGYQLGYQDPNYFIRFFRENVGVTPLAFRSRSGI